MLLAYYLSNTNIEGELSKIPKDISLKPEALKWGCTSESPMKLVNKSRYAVIPSRPETNVIRLCFNIYAHRQAHTPCCHCQDFRPLNQSNVRFVAHF